MMNPAQESPETAALVVCRCGESDPSKFYPTETGRPRRPCKSCRSAAQKRRYANDPHHADKNRAAVAAWKKRNPEKNRAQDRKDSKRRRERKLVNGNPISVEYADILRSDPCSYCGSSVETIDHIEPVVNGGTGEFENLTSACISCNSRKNKKSLIFFLATR